MHKPCLERREQNHGDCSNDREDECRGDTVFEVDVESLLVVVSDCMTEARVHRLGNRDADDSHKHRLEITCERVNGDGTLSQSRSKTVQVQNLQLQCSQ